MTSREAEAKKVAEHAVKQALEAALAAMRARNLEYCCLDPCTCESSRDTDIELVEAIDQRALVERVLRGES